ncbi:MAG: fibronectin type III domain-containing protein [Planctomycetes bacterium]|nr:fibronectin type III domain-containing protein [Planctomycetota bacterium]
MHALQRIAVLAVLAVLAVFAAAALPGEEPSRIGWQEEFEQATAWIDAAAKPVSGTPLATARAEGGVLTLTAVCGALFPGSKHPEWPEWPVEGGRSEFTEIQVVVDREVDLDVYRYLTVRVPAKSNYVHLRVNGRGTKVLYTTGVHAQDLALLGLTGKQRLTLSLSFLNASGSIALDWLRLVRVLDEQERPTLIPAGMVLREERLAASPYHGLEALNARAGRPLATARAGGEWCVYREPGTGAEIWKMTASPANDCRVGFNRDGSAFTVHGRAAKGFHVWDWPSRAFTLVEGGLSDASPRFSATEPSQMIIAENTWIARPRRRIDLFTYDFRTTEKVPLASFETDAPWKVQELSGSADSGKLLFGFRETSEVWLIDPSIPDIAKRATRIILPSRLKASHLCRSDTAIAWYRCYTYEGWQMDLGTGQLTLAHTAAVGHGAGGPRMSIGGYGEDLKLLIENDLGPQTEAMAEAERVRIFANYRQVVEVDYGCVTGDGQWMLTDGTKGDLYAQHLLFSIDDPAAVLHLCHHNTSRNEWTTNTYSSPSPDATKVAWISDQFDDGDVYLAITGRPAAPTAVTATRTGDGVALSWQAPASREIASYRIYRSAHSGLDFHALDQVASTNACIDRSPPAGPLFYVVVAVEPSGLEGAFSAEVAVDAPAASPRTVYIEAEAMAWRPPARVAFHGDASGSRYLRIHHASPDEAAVCTIMARFDLPAGHYAVWLRGRAEGVAGAWNRSSPDTGAIDFDRGSPEVRPPFTWRVMDTRLTTTGGAGTVMFSAGVDGLALDAIALSDDPAFDPAAAGVVTGPTVVPPPPATALSGKALSPYAIELSWSPGDGAVARYDVHVGDDPASLGNATIIGSTTGTVFGDSGLRPGTPYTYHVVAVDARGQHSTAVSVVVSTSAQAVQTEVVDLAHAELDARLVPVAAATGARLATLPAGDGVAAPAMISYAVDIRTDGDYLVWVTYRPAYAQDFAIAVAIDGKPAGTWQLRPPFSPMWKRDAAPEYVWTDKIVADGTDVFHFAPGRHVITLALDPKLGALQHAIGTLVVSNDHSFRPAGYSPQANWAKRWWQ